MRYKFALFPGLLSILLLGTFFLPGRFMSSAHAAGAMTLTDVGGLPPLISVSQLLGSDSHSKRTLQMSVSLALRNQAQLTRLLQDLYDPSSASYHQFLSVDAFAQQFGPTPDEEQTVENYLTQEGFTVTQTYPNHMLIDFSGPQSLAEQVFGVTINDYQDPLGRDFFANGNVPTLPAYLAAFVVLSSSPQFTEYFVNQSKRRCQLSQCRNGWWWRWHFWWQSGSLHSQPVCQSLQL